MEIEPIRSRIQGKCARPRPPAEPPGQRKPSHSSATDPDYTLTVGIFSRMAGSAKFC